MQVPDSLISTSEGKGKSLFGKNSNDFESLSDDYIKSAALEFLRQDDMAIANASKKWLYQ